MEIFIEELGKLIKQLFNCREITMRSPCWFQFLSSQNWYTYCFREWIEPLQWKFGFGQFCYCICKIVRTNELPHFLGSVDSSILQEIRQTHGSYGWQTISISAVFLHHRTKCCHILVAKVRMGPPLIDRYERIPNAVLRRQVRMAKLLLDNDRIRASLNLV